jgi:DNA polymerase III subunit delta'
MAPWIERQLPGLLQTRAHAWLLHGENGQGQFELAMAAAQALLCERPVVDTASGAVVRACGVCPSCHAMQVHTHADWARLLPEATMLELGWPLDERAQKEIDDKKRKPSRDIRVEQMRDALEFAQRTSARGQGKVVVIYPADRMNTVTANALLKTLEEPPEGVRFVLATGAAHLLLPTIRSRCMAVRMQPAQPDEAQHWLSARGVPAAEALVLLQATDGRPNEALALATEGMTATQWLQFPRAVHSGQVASLAGWSPMRWVDSLQKLAVDIAQVMQGGAARYFPLASVTPVMGKADLASITQWYRQLVNDRKTIEHPYNGPLLIDALVIGARRALHGRISSTPRDRL